MLYGHSISLPERQENGCKGRIMSLGDRLVPTSWERRALAMIWWEMTLWACWLHVQGATLSVTVWPHCINSGEGQSAVNSHFKNVKALENAFLFPFLLSLLLTTNSPFSDSGVLFQVTCIIRAWLFCILPMHSCQYLISWWHPQL